MNAVLDDTFVTLVDSLCALDDTTNGQPEMPEANRHRALAGLERILIDLPALDEHIRRLQQYFGRSFRHQQLLPDEEAERIVSHGAGVLSKDDLALLLLNPIALRDLAFRIGEDLPDYWLERMSEVGRQVMQAEGVARKPREVVVPASKEAAKPRPRNGEESFRASAWNDGGNTYGIRVGIPNRDKYFDPSWTDIEVEIDGQFHSFSLTPGFWRRCPEFRDCNTPVIRDWLRRHKKLEWPPRNPPRVQLVSLGGRRFRLVS